VVAPRSHRTTVDEKIRHGLRRWAAASVVGVILLLLGTAGAPAGAAPMPDQRVIGAVPAAGAVEQMLRDRLAASAVPGAAFVVIHREGASSAGGVGRTGDGGAVTARTPFVIGSTSKSFTALAIMQLVDEGVVDLDAPVRRYIPELRLADGQATDSITVRHLLQQTSGLPAVAGGPVVASPRTDRPPTSCRNSSTWNCPVRPGRADSTRAPTTSWPDWSWSAPRACPTPTTCSAESFSRSA
jgi:CubicO group peptidase (beta-lactamase class C family)